MYIIPITFDFRIVIVKLVCVSTVQNTIYCIAIEAWKGRLYFLPIKVFKKSQQITDKNYFILKKINFF